jgi:hypothetical protein
MNHFVRTSLWLPIAIALLGSLAVPRAAFAQPGTTAVDAPVVKLEVDCNSAPNCFESAVALTDWISGTRTPDPSASAPLLVEIGPGEFPGGITCGLGNFSLFQFQKLSAKRFDYVTFRGAGPDVTRIGAKVDPLLGIDTWAIGADGCNHLNFEELTADGLTYGIFWQGTGSSQWINVKSYGNVSWYDFLCDAEDPRPVHYIYSSRFESRGGPNAYVSECGENWLYGSDVVAVGTGLGSGATPIGVVVAKAGDFRAFGSTIRVTGGTATNLAGGIGVKVGYPINGSTTGGGVLRLHGTVVNVDVTGSSGADATGLLLHPTPTLPMTVNTAGTAFHLTAGSGGDHTRVNGAGAESPFQWPAGTGVPRPNFSSEDGSDTYVETDCGSDGDCDGGGTETHLMIYNEAECPSEKWFDSTTRCCRNEILPGCL